ncbi:hypothetical protein AB0L13_36415 [Saccharopolyspora shandongensis]|uniref:hypothetical protein n=1 Tax=Saccharopolyspora shandongensis TaxID=418495 RepID=UPI0034458FA2
MPVNKLIVIIWNGLVVDGPFGVAGREIAELLELVRRTHVTTDLVQLDFAGRQARGPDDAAGG